MVGCGKKTSQNSICGDISFDNKIMICEYCLNPKKTCFKPLKEVNKVFSELPLIKPIFALCVYIKYYVLSATASMQGKGKPLNLYSAEDKK